MIVKNDIPGGTSTKTTPASDVPTIHKRDIFGSSEFKTEDDLSYHIRTIH